MKIESKMLDKYFEERRIFSRFEAAVFILSEGKKTGGVLTLSLAELLEKFQWSNKMKVSRFLSEMESDAMIEKIPGGYKLLNQAKELARIDVEHIQSDEFEIPTFQFQPEAQPEGVPPTAKQLFIPNPQPQTFIDMDRVDWTVGINVPKLRLYKRYLDANTAYIIQETDAKGLETITRNIEHQLRAFYRKQGKATTKRDILNAIDNFVDNVQKTFYKGFPLDHIAKEYNKVTSAILKLKERSNV
jgi:hypothetical protein